MSDHSTVTFVAVLLAAWFGSMVVERRAARRPDMQGRLSGPVIVSCVLALLAVGQALTLLFYAVAATGSGGRRPAAPPSHLFVGGGVLLILAVLMVIVRQPRRGHREQVRAGPSPPHSAERVIPVTDHGPADPNDPVEGPVTP